MTQTLSGCLYNYSSSFETLHSNSYVMTWVLWCSPPACVINKPNVPLWLPGISSSNCDTLPSVALLLNF